MIPPITALEAKTVAQIDGHFCYDWDGMAVSAWTYEYDCCVCIKKTLRGRIVNWFVMWNFYRVERKVRQAARRERLDRLYTERRRLEHKLYELRCAGEYMGEYCNQERAARPGPSQWKAYENELLATRQAVIHNEAAIRDEHDNL